MFYANIFDKTDLFSHNNTTGGVTTVLHYMSLVMASNATYSETFNYTDSFSVVLDEGTGTRVYSLLESRNVQFEFLDYVFIIIGQGGIYSPDYQATWHLQHALSVTLWEGDITQMSSLMGKNLLSFYIMHYAQFYKIYLLFYYLIGQINGYWIFAPAAPSIGD